MIAEQCSSEKSTGCSHTKTSLRLLCFVFLLLLAASILFFKHTLNPSHQSNGYASCLKGRRQIEVTSLKSRETTGIVKRRRRLPGNQPTWVRCPLLWHPTRLLWAPPRVIPDCRAGNNPWRLPVWSPQTNKKQKTRGFWTGRIFS